MFGTNLFGIGMPELIFIAVIALIVLGPQRLPGVMREVAKFIAQLRSLTSELTSQFSEEIALLEELDPRKLIDEATKPVNDAVKALDPKTPAKPKPKSTTAKSTASSSSTAPAATEIQEETKEEAFTNASLDESDEPAERESNDNDSHSADSSANLVEDLAEVDDGKPKPQMQTDPANAASTEPYKNRTPNLNLIKPRTPKPQADADQADLAETDPMEENSMIPPDMQTKPVQRSVQNDGSTASSLAAGKQNGSNGHKSSSNAAPTDDKLSESTTAEEESLDLE